MDNGLYMASDLNGIQKWEKYIGSRYTLYMLKCVFKFDSDEQFFNNG